MWSQTIAIHFVHAALRGTRRRGIDVWPLLAEAGIPPALLDDDRARVTTTQFARLIRCVWRTLDDEFMGLGPQPSKPGSFEMMCRLAIHSSTLETALQRAFAFYALFPMPPRLSLTRGPGEARLELDLGDLDDPDRFFTESLLLVIHRFAGWAIGRRLRLTRAEFVYPAPEHIVEYRSLFGCPLKFGQPATLLALDDSYLSAPVMQDEVSLAAMLRTAPAELLSLTGRSPTASDRVRQILAQRGTGSTPGVDEVAARLGVSPQTLRRHLREEGTSYRRIKEEVLRDIAIASLARGKRTVEEVATLLGFSDASAFHRAFKRWTGTTPGAYRTTDM